MSRTRPRASRGLTLTDLCVATAVAVLLLGGALPFALARTRESGTRVKCASNLRQIGLAIQQYRNENKGSLPRAVYDPNALRPVAYTAPNAPNPFLPGGPGPNDVTAGLFLLLRTQDITSEVFVCPLDDAAEPWRYDGGTAQTTSNFPGRQFLSYSYHNPYSPPRWPGLSKDITLGPTFAVAADMNPGSPELLTIRPDASRTETGAVNSRNHNGDGQNVLYGDGHVDYSNTPFCGVTGRDSIKDNIYTYAVSRPGQWSAPGSTISIQGTATVDGDSIMLPTRLDGPQPLAKRPVARWLWASAGPLAFAAVTAIVVWCRRERRPTTAVHQLIDSGPSNRAAT